ncbi:hypothetical protein CMI37_26970 [Candidatus Pacearchaeota archaeon]|nr:hypothetical protein [Candidatus Pacearchaeota archaeon]|tara:strand:+ start:26583 stop:27191 length:609 start_codon:yes stop_codon:yes gene_type:complete
MRKTYASEKGKPVDLSRLTADRLPLDIYQKAHQGLVLPCQDVAIEHQGGILLVNRDNNPAKNVLWPLGGRLERGMTQESSLREKVRNESGLSLLDPLIYLGQGRTFFNTDPFEHGHGTDTENSRYFARSTGILNLDSDHSKPIIVKPSDYNPEFRAALEPYVQDFLDMAIHLVGQPEKWLWETKELIDQSLLAIILRNPKKS